VYSHIAFNVISCAGILSGSSVSHHENALHSFVGVGTDIFSQQLTIIESILLQPSVSNVIVYGFASRFAYKVLF
jgi:hypothetical protein